MKGYLTDVPGIRVGHAGNDEALTGVTVILTEDGAVCGVDVRGSAPGTRETDLLAPEKLVERVHAICLSGGSAFGLDAAGGVMKYLEDGGYGLDVSVCKVPIVPAAVIFDLAVGDPFVRPDAAMGREACENASEEERGRGNVGAGIGASVGKFLGPSYAMKGGLGSASIRVGDVVVAALVVVNCVGDVIDPSSGKRIAGIYDREKRELLLTMEILKRGGGIPAIGAGNTTIGVVATNAALTKAQAKKVAEMAHDGYARAIDPIHTMHDGDTIFSLSTGTIEADVTVIGALGADVMAKACIDAVCSAKTVVGLPAVSEISQPKQEKLENGV